MKKKLIWLWLGITFLLSAYLAQALFVSDEKETFLIGEATHGHYQIEMACETCHSTPFGGSEVLQNACTDCHAEELENAHDSHPKKKFTDPREAYRLELLDARYCVSCHTEHQKEKTHKMGLTIPEDYCFHCHQEVIQERESHQGLAFDSCGSAGCHNYHDNRALYESFLVANAGQPWLKAIAQISPANAASQLWNEKGSESFEENTYIEKMEQHPEIAQHWQASRHGEAGVDCGGCHEQTDVWVEHPKLDTCEQCHLNEVRGFKQGKHGMRASDHLSQPLSPVTPLQSPLLFKADSLNVQHGCNSCHGAHQYSVQEAAAESCLGCHDDEHSKNFIGSPHGELWEQERAGELPEGSGVSCATCHMPRIEKTIKNQRVVAVEHNQNDNLRPNEKMIRPVCMQCHSLAFSIDALADSDLIKNNFRGQPGTHIESVDWALERNKEK